MPVKATHNSISPPRSAAGFTLVEMSIILIILALAAGGILLGAELIRAAKVRSVVSENEAYSHALRSFKERYKFYPGDFPSATSIWGALDSNHNTCITTEALHSSTATCNGNGDGMIGGIGNGDFTTNGAQLYEMFRAWQHLANAELITGYFTGTSYSSPEVNSYASAPLRHANSASVYGENAPLSDYGDGTGWNVATVWGLYNSCNNNNSMKLNGNALVFGTASPHRSFNVGMTDGLLNLLSPLEVKSLDDKVDDGMPNTGNLQVIGTSCAKSCAANAIYDTESEAKRCAMVFVNQF